MPRLLDSGRRRHSLRPFLAAVESLERLYLLSDVTMLSLTETTGTTLSFDYNVQVPNLTALQVNFYRLPTSVLSGAAAVKIGSTTLSGNELTEGTHDNVTAVLNTPLASGAAPLSIDPANPYVFAVTTGPDHVSTEASFQKYTLGVVTHGLVFPPSKTVPGWITRWPTPCEPMATTWRSPSVGRRSPPRSLSPVRRRTPAIRWPRRSRPSSKRPGIVPKGAVVDIQLIGHSRGSVVITQAAEDLQNDLPNISQAAGGYWLLTYLDPHPAHAANVVPFAVANNTVGKDTLRLANLFQEGAKDPYGHQLIFPRTSPRLRFISRRLPAI